MRRGQPVPASLVLISPWLDATMTDTAPRHFDPFLNVDTCAPRARCGRATSAPTIHGSVHFLFGSHAAPTADIRVRIGRPALQGTFRCREPPRPQSARIWFDMRWGGALTAGRSIRCWPRGTTMAPMISRQLLGCPAA